MTTFTEWFDANLAEYAEDITEHGCDGGFPHITYTSDCVELYDQFEGEIYDRLNETADDMSYTNVEQLVSTFGRADMLSWPEGRKNLLLWFMVEEEARNRAGA